MTSRKKTHGEYYINAELISKIRSAIHAYETEALAKDFKTKVALDYIIFKLARIITGDKDFLDHWEDISGYAMLQAEIIKKGRK